jgi:sugar porter (SP) family MFS transporter|mmetsp:Transcript_15901/g.25306  ORF Transcript_15901/g.25306 Transcript_15901/m.25306 type:complete len:493 (-) Transcript_15901:86-1564(-)
MGSGSWPTLISLVSALGSFLFGLDIGYIASILECPSFKRDVGHLDAWQDPHSRIAGATTGFIVGVFSIGCILSAFPMCSAFFLDSWGRKSSISFGTCVFLVGCVLQACSMSVFQFILGRLIAGFSIGLLSTVVPLYQSELSAPSMRGALVSLNNLLITSGILFATWLNFILVGRDGGWRLSIYLQAGPAIVLIVGTWFMPRSPRWLIQKGLASEALEVLKSLRSCEAEARQEFDEIMQSNNVSIASEPTWSELFKGRSGRLLAVGISMQLLQQFTGINAFMYFGPRIFQLSGLDPFLLQTLTVAVNFLATFPAIFLADRCGRRCLLSFSALGMGLSCLAMAAAGNSFLHKTSDGVYQSSNTVAPKLVTAMAFAFITNFAYGWGPIVWVYCAELFPLRYRSRCFGITTTANWAGNYMIAQLTPMMLNRVEFNTFLVFGFFSFLALILARWLPETKGVMLEKVGELFDTKFGVPSEKWSSISPGSGYGAAARIC